MKIFPVGGVRGGGAAPPAVNLGPPHISETTRARKFKSYTHLDEAKYSFHHENISGRGRTGGAAPPTVNLRPPHISETTRARKFKFYTHLDGAKYSFQDENFSGRGRCAKYTFRV